MKLLIYLLISIPLFSQYLPVKVLWYHSLLTTQQTNILVFDHLEAIDQINSGDEYQYSIQGLLSLYVDVAMLSNTEIEPEIIKLIETLYLLDRFNQMDQKIMQYGSTFVNYHPFTNGVERIGNIEIDYDEYNRITRIGHFEITYESFKNRVLQIGKFKFEYDERDYRVTRIGDVYIDYDVFEKRIRAIDGKKIKYDNFKHRVEEFNGMPIRYDERLSKRIPVGSKHQYSTLPREEIEKIKKKIQDLSDQNELLRSEQQGLKSENNLLQNMVFQLKQENKRLKEKN